MSFQYVFIHYWSLLLNQSVMPDNDQTLLPVGKKSLLCYGLSINPWNKFLYYSISSRSNLSMSNCNAGLRCII